jgi:Ca-activated chloride channel family protein
MALLWPWFLLLLAIIPLLIGAYIWILRRRRRFTIRYSSLALVREALPHQSRLRRHLPFALFILALTSLILALVRPVSIISVPSGQATIILTIDVSMSMCSTDIQPNRLLAAESAALSFIKKQKPSTQIGLVAFSGYAELIHPPSNDSETLTDAIDSLLTGRRTAIGSAILKSLDAIAEVDPNVAASIAPNSTAPKPAPVPKGAYAPDIIVLLTDGASNTGPLPLDAAQQAVDRGIRIYTIGFGTANGSQFPNCSPQFQGNEPAQGQFPGSRQQNGGSQFPRGQQQFGGGGGFSGGGGFGGGGQQAGGFRRGIDEATLKKIAEMTGGTYYPAESAAQLQAVFQNLPTSLITKHETTEISVFFVLAGALLAALGIMLSLIWHPLA